MFSFIGKLFTTQETGQQNVLIGFIQVSLLLCQNAVIIKSTILNLCL